MKEGRYLMTIKAEELHPNSNSHSLTVTTLGLFDVKKGTHSLSGATPGSKKIWELFKFMLTHRQRSFTQESLVEFLWSSEDYSNPRSTLRQQMHRLRQALEESPKHPEQQIIIFNNGYYHWNLGLDIQIDIDQFERAVQLGDKLKEDQQVESLTHYREALSLYQGDYLSECIDHHWVFPIRNYYRRLYISTVLSTVDLLQALEKFSEILQICEQAIQLDIYKEEFHLCYMEALLQLGERKQALKHYEYITGFYYHEMGLKPTLAFKKIYKRILSTQATYLTMDDLDSDLENKVLENAFYCKSEIFRSIYELERRRSERSDVKAIIGMITINHSMGDSLGRQHQRILSFKQHLLEHLRKGDTVTLWNDSQFLVLLPGLDEGMMDKVLSRIFKLYFSRASEANTNIQAQYHLILPPQDNLMEINERDEFSV